MLINILKISGFFREEKRRVFKLTILIFNCGSSSLNYKIFRVDSTQKIKILAKGKVHRVGTQGSHTSFIEHDYKNNRVKEIVSIADHQTAALLVLKYIKDNSIPIDYIGHRFVHGGNYFKNSVLINNENLKKLEACFCFAPIHNSNSLSVISTAKDFFRDIPQYVSFDTAFHNSIPDYAYTYALPQKIIKDFGFRKHGFHGLSYQYVTQETAFFLKIPVEKLKIVVCHLGTGGASVCAVKNGKSLDTSMGFSPLPGLIMSTRCGDIDPMLAIYLTAIFDYKPHKLLELFNKKSGLLGISGFSSDIRDIIERFSSKDEKQAELAFNMYIHSLKKYIGSYIAILGGIDVLVFTDDIGVETPLVREKVCADMDWLGLKLDKTINQKVNKKKTSVLNSKNSKVYILSVPTDEEVVICREGYKLFKKGKAKVKD